MCLCQEELRLLKQNTKAMEVTYSQGKHLRAKLAEDNARIVQENARLEQKVFELEKLIENVRHFFLLPLT